MFFFKYYQDFNLIFLSGEFWNYEFWKMLNYVMVDINFGYDIYFKKFKLNINGGVFNVLNSLYLMDVMNNGNYDVILLFVYVGVGI